MSAHAGHRERIQAALADGFTFADLHATGDGSGVRVTLVTPGGDTRLETTVVNDGVVPSIVDLVPAAGWDEREAHDLYGIRFDGHEPLRPLVDHDPVLSHWTVPVTGRDAYQVAVGPIHAGVIESGHFRLHVVGDRVLHLDVRLFYKHRGLERAAEGGSLEEGSRYVARACGGCAVANGVAYALACEQALGLTSPVELARARTILLELERAWNHLNDISAVCAGVGLAAGTMRFAALTERMRRLNGALAGHRFLFDSVHVGGSDLTVDRETLRTTAHELSDVRDEAAGAWRELIFNGSFQDRLDEIGVVGAADVARLGTVGPAARAAGVAIDVRQASPQLAYDGFRPAAGERTGGDVGARVEQRAVELGQTFELLESLLDRPLEPVSAVAGADEHRIGIGRVESPRGATSCIVERTGDRLDRVRLRTGSYANWPSVTFAAVDDLLPDFPLINKSFELCYACADR